MGRLTTLGLALSIVTFAACDASSVIAPNAALASLEPQASRVVAREITGYLDGTDTYGEPCADGLGISLVSVGIGDLSHFGHSVLTAPACLDPITFAAIGPLPYVIRAANGDEVSGVVTDIEFTSYGFDMYADIEAGTGRFAGASGELVFITDANFTGVWRSRIVGSITY